MSRFLLVLAGACVFLGLSHWLSRPDSRAEPRSDAELAMRGEGRALTSGVSDVDLPPAPPAGSAPPPEDVLAGQSPPPAGDPVELQSILEEMEATESRCVESLEAATDPRIFSLDLRTLVKTQAARERARRGDYQLVDSSALVSLRETVDQTVIAFPVLGKHALFVLTRQLNPDVFLVIDQCAASQQDDWNLAAIEFNSKTASEREAAIQVHKAAMARIQGLYDEVEASGSEGIVRAEALLAKQGELAELRSQLLPWYLVIPKRGSTVWARTSIGR